MKWPWVSRRWYDYETKWLKDNADRWQQQSGKSIKHAEEMVDMYIELKGRYDQLQADANSMRARLKANGNEAYKLFGPWNDSQDVA